MSGKSELFKAVKNNDLENIKDLVEQGANLHANAEEALRKAAGNAYLEVVKHLLGQGADLHADNDGALRWAGEKGRLEVVKYLLERGADSDILSEQKLAKLFTSYDLHIKKITPRLSSLLLKIKLVKKSAQTSTKNKILSRYKEKIVSSLVILMYRLYYRPSGPGFFQAIEQV